MTATVFVILAGLMGAAGVVLAAASAHMAPGAGLDSAASMLLYHAAGVLGATAAINQGLVLRPLGIAAVTGLVLGAGLFSADIALRAFSGHRLFPMAAPTGGTILIAGWLALALAAVLAFWRHG